ncbi:MAG: DUF3151 family protein [Actinobacteria bacterium]|nr:DUF3151 family protein [Actinomycetota bacterium]
MSNVNLSGTGPGEVRLPAAPPDLLSQLDRALAQPDSARREAVAKVVAANPRYLDGWAWLGALGRDSLESYMAYRIGYHRGLDTLRANGWKGSGYVRWDHVPNRGFLRCVEGLANSAEKISEHDEATRCRQFLMQLDPNRQQ